ncbi:ferritin-like domain-containing protein [Archangium lansingense]|uniref:Ferritin-like domain-containing protein n=1 Tax=Archangium lansingense TaxID=2995310 RepID=A0ABT3ZUY6_9BACT|nr:ferritin-like domain-containing protein [Archangium lansinium]MCY1073208.1 ferritin-like domain-containing protein [Archangium lansinium]
MRSRMSRHLGSILRLEQAPTLRALAVEARGVKPLIRTEPVLPPEFSWHDYAVLLLHIAAEVEHALMVQYLYAAYSLGGPQVPPKHRDRVRHWQEVVLGIAKEEMGHLITVQNVLRLIGGPLNLDREDYPWGNDFYPFEFTLEPLTKDSLARYIFAEMPAGWDTEEAREIKKRAAKGSSGQPLHRVGELYDRMQKILANPEYVKEADFQAATTTFQASWDEWGRGYMRGARGQATSSRRQSTPDVIVQPVSSRDEAVEALAAVGKQGEARFYDQDLEERSHFRRFLEIYREYPEGEWTPTRPVPINPKTVMDLNANQVVRSFKAVSRGGAAPPSANITHPESSRWAHLFNLRYRMLLVNLSHAYELAGAIGQGDVLTARGLLINRTFGEMYNVRSISNILVELPLDESGSGVVAAPPFEMPYSLDLPPTEADRWRLHRDLLEASQNLTRQLRELYPNRHTDYLRALEDLDAEALASVRKMIPKS